MIELWDALNLIVCAFLKDYDCCRYNMNCLLKKWHPSYKKDWPWEIIFIYFILNFTEPKKCCWQKLSQKVREWNRNEIYFQFSLSLNVFEVYIILELVSQLNIFRRNGCKHKSYCDNRDTHENDLRPLVNLVYCWTWNLL